jgi:sulfur transfer protein SufE
MGFLGEIGMDEHLSPTRKNGLHAMVRQIEERAAALA